MIRVNTGEHNPGFFSYRARVKKTGNVFTRVHPAGEGMMATIHVSSFQPFESRRGVVTVLALRFPYDPELINVLKSALREAARVVVIYNAGGWLAEHRCWFCERDVWPLVRERLAGAGYCFTGPEAGNHTGNDGRRRERPHDRRDYSPPADVRGVVTSWYREMALRFHPDRTLDNGAAMKAINHAHDRLQELLGIL
jgi:hypothetical protein